MPELRYNMAIRDWVIIATERAKRPEDFSSKPYTVSADSATNCPFCPGHEAKTPPEVFVIRDPGTQPNAPGWQVRVTPNAFPALQSKGQPLRSKDNNGFLSMSGVGRHEVIIESPEHDKVIATMEQSQVEKIFKAYKQRYTELSKDPRFESLILFKNHGRSAGTSLSHPHSQLIALPINPRSLRSQLEVAQSHFDEAGTCVYCDVIAMEKQDGRRIVWETDNFIAFVPYASRMPFEMWVLPKAHASNFDVISDEHCVELAGIVKQVLGKLYRAVGNPDFNYAVFSAPIRERDIEFFHWSMRIFPRVSTPAGFEIGSGVMINTVVPESAAQYLKAA